MDAKYIDDFVDAYIECALWSSTIDDRGTPMDDDYGSDDLHADALSAIRIECIDFCEAHESQLAEADAEYGRGAESCGHDFWLTRNGHGAGFWDRGMEKLGDSLSDAAHSYGSSDLYIGDDGKVHVS